MNWIDIEGILFNLNNISSISMFHKTIRFWIVSEKIPLDVMFDTEEKAKICYERLKEMLLIESSVNDLLSESEIAIYET